VDISKRPQYENPMNEDIKVYRNLHFEHSDTCPSRRNREIALKRGEEPKVSKKTLKMATCAYIMD